MTVAVVVVVAIIVGYFVYATAIAPTTMTRRLVFGLDWAIFGRHAAYFVAVDKGFFRDEGLEVEVVRGYGSADTISKVAGGAVDVGFADFGSLVRAKQENPDLDVKMVLVVYGKAPYTIFTLRSRGILEPRDLEGRTIGGPPGDANRVMFPAFARLVGIDPGKVNWVNIEATAKTPMLLAGQVDAIPEYFMHKAVLEREAAKMGDEVVYFLYADYGLTIYSNGIIFPGRTIREDPELVRRFVRAIIRAWEWTFQNPDEAIDILLSYQPKLDKEIARREIDIVRELVYTEEAREKGLGYMSRAKVEESIRIVFEAFGLGAPTIDPDDVYTMRFHPAGG